MDTYTVQKGDTLGGIAKKLKMKLGDLIKYNAALIRDPNKIKIGWNLKLNDGPPPEKAGGPIKGKGGRGYTITYEDTGKPDYKPKVVNPESPTGRKASAPLVEEKWRKGKEIFHEVKTPVEIAIPAPKKPHPPMYGNDGKAISEAEYQNVISGAGRPPAPGLMEREFGSEPGNWVRAATTEPGKFLPTAFGSASEAMFGADPESMARLGSDALMMAGMAGTGGMPGPSFPRLAPTRAEPFFNPEAPRLGGVVRGPDNKFMRPVGFRKEPTLPANKKPPITMGPDNKFRRGSWPEGQNPNLKPYKGEKPEPPMTRTVSLDKPPAVVRAHEMRSVADWRNTLRENANNTVVIDGASDLGFAADRLIIVPGKGGLKRLDPNKVMDSADPPVVSQGFFVKMLKHLGYKGG